ncbi:biliverdin-producing heme oxygenase [Paraburkholderia sp. BL21I4N1]|uniref:biliverdin-producing heme oxygenase n=1 Tax=Paraburkholderia sp. BL21I4N1 TaxID=1938801 RepID=UPI000CFCAC3E|nr:biliverdin-producing heme oxygenase [Paraburkholderia sp. BL21I4N1]PQV44702.1 heme oxygenase [Paraburkholderia sp. BL21I4N1]
MLNRTRLIDTPESVNRVSPGQDGALGALRAATAQRHELLHTIMPLSVESVALRDYLAHLAILRDWLAPLEAWLGQFDDGPQASTLPARIDRLALIDADLAHAAARRQAVRVDVSAPARLPVWRGAQSAAYRWGVCYVIEGSQLGGAVLYARLKARLAPHPLSYLAAGRETLGARWQAFIRALSAEVHTPATIDAACRGAAAAFDRLIELAQCPTSAACANVD